MNAHVKASLIMAVVLTIPLSIAYSEELQLYLGMALVVVLALLPFLFGAGCIIVLYGALVRYFKYRETEL